MTKQSRAKNTRHQPRDAAHETARQAERNFEQSARAGQRATEEAIHWWCRMVSGAGWQMQIELLNKTVQSAVPLAQRNWDEWLELCRNSNQAGAELIKKTMERPLAGGNQEYFIEWWSSAVQTAQGNIAAATRFGTRAMDSLTEFLRLNAQAAAESTAQPA